MRFTAWSLPATLSSLALLACSDPPPPTAQGGVQYEVTSTSSAPSGKTCALPGGFNVGVGNPPPDSDGEDPGKRIVDGEHSATINCTVSGDKTVTFSGEVDGYQKVEATGETKHARLQISGTLNEDGTGTADVQTLVDGSTYHNTEPCTLQGVVVDGKNQWGDDLVWTTFDCNFMEDGQINNMCQASGAIVLEKCK